MNDTTYELCLSFKDKDDGKQEILMDMLLSMGLRVDEIIVSIRQNKTHFLIYFKNKSEAQKFRYKINNIGLKDISIQSKTLKKQDWQTVWKKDFKPFQISEHFDIVPAWNRNTYKSKNRECIYIDTTLAFGTGLHATTRFMTQFVDRCRGKYDSFLDIGTGTGILAIVAHKCGAKYIKGVDISDDAVNVAKKNAIENNTPGIKFFAGDFFKLNNKEKFDYVAANLVTDDLVKYRKEIFKCVKTDKYLAISGISVANYDWLREFYDKLPLRCVKVEKAEGWAAILYKKIKK